MAALAQKGVGEGRAALFPSPRHHGRAPAPQKCPPCPKHPLPWERRPWACVRPGRKRRKRRKAQPRQPPSTEPSPKRGRGPLPYRIVGQGVHVRHVQEGTFCFQPSFSQDFLDRLMELTGHPPPAAMHPRRGRDQVLVRGPRWPQGMRLQERWHWGEPWPQGSVGTVGAPWDTWESVGSAGIPCVLCTPYGTREHPKRSGHPRGFANICESLCCP